MRKIIIILDGIADIPPYTSLQSAKTPNLDFLAKHSQTGLMYPIKGTAPESGESQFVILGKNLGNYPGRGPLEALGLNIHLKKNQIALRANFAVFKGKKLITRRANPPSIKILDKLNHIHPDIKIYPSIAYRAVVIVKNASPKKSDTDPAYKKLENHSNAVTPRMFKLKVKGDKKTAEKLNFFIARAEKIMKTKTILLRGAGTVPKQVRQMKNWAIIADMPVEIGLGKLLGMQILDRSEIIQKLRFSKSNLYIQIKGPDIWGHLGNKNKKIKAIEKIDRLLAPLKQVKDAVICITSDHATPYQLMRHSNHPVPYLIYNPRKPVNNSVKKFSELECRKGKTIQGKDIMDLL